MRSTKQYVAIVAVGLMISLGAQLASASIITNGTFDTDLSGWSTAGTTTGVTWVAGTAHVGRPGTPGVAIFSQTFDIPAGTSQLGIKFDYEWQVNPPPIPDTFLVELIYQSTSGAVTETLLSETSAVGSFGPTTTSFNTILGLTNLDNVLGNGTIRFTLTEVNSPVGTRIELDNVDVGVVPEASAFIVWSALTGLGLVVRRRLGAA